MCDLKRKLYSTILGIAFSKYNAVQMLYLLSFFTVYWEYNIETLNLGHCVLNDSFVLNFILDAFYVFMIILSYQCDNSSLCSGSFHI